MRTYEKTLDWLVTGRETTLSFVPPKPANGQPNGLTTDFGHGHPSNDGYQASEYEARLAERQHDLIVSYRHTRRARQYQAPYERVMRSEIIERDNSTCHICGQPCEPHDIHLDHVIPLSKGGTHTADNLRVAHAYCNLSKGSKLLEASHF